MPLIKVCACNGGKYNMTPRELCPGCHQRPVAINCRKKDKIYYRKVCDVCAREGKKIRPAAPAWFRSGYRKKPQCERCGFKAKFPEQLGVFYLDGNLKNNNWLNLRTACLNCQQEIYKNKLSWKAAPTTPGF